MVLVLTTAPGCRLLMEKNVAQPIQAPPLKVTEKVKPVQPDEITAANARAKAQQLLEEMEQDAGKK
jgi:hypothetical protein